VAIIGMPRAVIFPPPALIEVVQIEPGDHGNQCGQALFLDQPLEFILPPLRGFLEKDPQIVCPFLQGDSYGRGLRVSIHSLIEAFSNDPGASVQNVQALTAGQPGCKGAIRAGHQALLQRLDRGTIP
jgi:hypothetical protein